MAKLIEITGKVLSGEWGTDDETGNGIPVLRTTNFTNEGIVDYSNVVTRNIVKKGIEEKYLRNGDIIIEKSGGSDKQPVGRVIYFDGPERTYLFNNFTGLLRVKNQEKWHPRYVFYSLFSNYRSGGTRTFQNKTTGLHNLKTDDYVSSFNVTENDIATQEAICKKLDLVDGIIRMHQKQLQKLDDLVKARFVELFGDPISNPKGWKKDKAESHIDLLSGYPFQSEQYVNDGINICGGLIIMPQKIQWQDCRHWPSVDGYEDYLLAEDDIVMALDRPWISEGFKIAQVDTTHLPALLIQRTARIRGIDVNQQYLFHCFVNGGFDKHSNVTGSLVPHISAKDIRSFEILLPPIKLQKQFAAFVKQVDKSKVIEAINKANILFNITLNGGNRYDIRANEF